MKTITIAQVKKLVVICPRDLTTAREIFGEGEIPITMENARKALWARIRLYPLKALAANPTAHAEAEERLLRAYIDSKITLEEYLLAQAEILVKLLLAS